MIQFDRRCCVCGKPTSSHFVDEIDGKILCKSHYSMVIGFMAYEGMDDDWHFYNIKDLALL